MAEELKGKSLLPLHLGASTADGFLLEAKAVKYLGAKSEDAASVEDALTQLFAAVGGDGIVASVKLNDEGTKLIVAYADGSAAKEFDIKQTEIVDNLTSESTEAALSAAQGKALKGLIDDLKVKGLVAGNGIELTNNNGEWTVAAKIDAASEFLSVGTDGIKVSGVTDAISAAVETETNRAKAAEKVNADAIDVLNGDASTEGSVKKAVADAKSQILGDAAAEYNTLGKLEDKIQEVDAKASAAHTKVNAKADGHVTVAVESKTTADGVAYSEVTVSENDIASDADLQAEITRAKAAEDTIEASVGLAEDGSHKTTTGNYTKDATTVVEEIAGVDAQVKVNADALSILNGDETIENSVKYIAKQYAGSNEVITLDSAEPGGKVVCKYTFDEMVALINGSEALPPMMFTNLPYMVMPSPKIAYVVAAEVNGDWIKFQVIYQADRNGNIEIYSTALWWGKTSSVWVATADTCCKLAKYSDLKTAITAGNASITVNTSSALPSIKVALSSTPGLLALETDGLSAKLTADNALSITDHAISLKIDDNDKILSQSEAGLLSTLSLSYNSTDKKIYLYGKDTTAAISEVDATDFIKDGMLNSAEYDNTTHKLTLTFNTDSGKDAIDVDLSDLVDTYKAGTGLSLANDGTFSIDDTVATKEYVDSKVADLDVDANVSTAVKGVTVQVDEVDGKVQTPVVTIADGAVEADNANLVTGGVVNAAIEKALEWITF